MLFCPVAPLTPKAVRKNPTSHIFPPRTAKNSEQFLVVKTRKSQLPIFGKKKCLIFSSCLEAKSAFFSLRKSKLRKNGGTKKGELSKIYVTD